ncbi:fungal-specific transcription factor domain-containing protein [Microdochium trichocladiopsis]|uniref:Fungal-specific transcription factor domain-containing protein n=1 Tax=Microdochium trichocladiopsis TaxID=1682393 RepID=A0A9P8Y6L5_9PEZI|nr:fungal-specific transcription factor domain-containing protein [Microdochium trichocladiopsis]KAH7029106.1 fungal-specific transcription factor domain-containing protein [Microdochium trichocladiopsis]
MPRERTDSSIRKRKSSARSSQDDIGSSKRPKKSVACNPCHARKVKCSGGEPCSNCEQAKCPADCKYPVRDAKVTVSESYIEKLLEENRQLRQTSTPTTPRDNSNTITTTAQHDQRSQTAPTSEQRDSARNPLLDDRGWFYRLGSSGSMPVHIGEAADTAFATRLRQALAENNNLKHMPRIHYVSDERLTHLAASNCPWPSMPRARLLIKFAMDTVGSVYHTVRRSEIYGGLKQHYQNLPTADTVFGYKLWALFALGEVYSCRTPAASPDNFPGLGYFAQACRILGQFRERPQFDDIEVLLLLSLYNLLINRRYTAHALASMAVRQGTVIGLNHNIALDLLPDRAAQEHRTRVWWTAYLLERLWASKMGHAVSIQDDDITVSMPSQEGLPESVQGDFIDVEHVKASIRLARLSRDMINSIYNRNATQPFSQRVQKTLGELRAWVKELPTHLQIESREPGRPLMRHVKWLHMTFNQLVIVATRPVLLHVFRTNKQLWSTPTPAQNLRQEVGETMLALAEACIRCARHSHQLLTDCWIDGSFAIFDYTYTQYLFSATTILAISSLSIGRSDQEDKDSFEYAYQFIDQLKKNGNFAALEFWRHVDEVRLGMLDFLSKMGGGGGVSDPVHGPNGLTLGTGESAAAAMGRSGGNAPSLGPFMPSSASHQQQQQQHHLAHIYGGGGGTAAATTPNHTGYQSTMTTEMALAEPSLQDFLSQAAELDLGFLDTQMHESGYQSLYVPGVPPTYDSWDPS